MKNRSVRRALFAALLVPLVAIATAAPALADPAARTVIADQPAWTAQAPVVDQTPAAAPQNLTVVLKLRDEAGAEALAAAVSDPANASVSPVRLEVPIGDHVLRRPTTRSAR